MLLEASVTGRKVQSEKPSVDRSSVWADVQPSPASDSRDRWDLPLLNADGIFRHPGHQGKVNVTGSARVRSGCPKLARSSGQKGIKQLKVKEASGW